MSFMYEVEKDNKRNFFNEFSSRINFCGIKLTALIRDDSSKIKKSAKYSQNSGLTQKHIILAFEKRDLPLIPHVKEVVTVDEVEYTVLEINEKLKLIELVLEKVDSNVFN